MQRACVDGMTGRKTKAQSGIEYILIVAFLLMMLVPIFIYSVDFSTLSVRTSRSKNVVESLAIAADNVCGMGGGSSYVDVYIPYGAQYSVIREKTIKLGITIGNGIGEAFSRTMCNVSGSIPLSEGYASIQVRMLQNGTVRIG